MVVLGAMPYSVDDLTSLPANVRSLSVEKQRQWVHVWNSTYQSCRSSGGADCEAKAFQVANGVVKGSEMTDENNNYVQVSGTTYPYVVPWNPLQPGIFISPSAPAPTSPSTGTSPSPLSHAATPSQMPGVNPRLEKNDERVGYKATASGDDTCDGCRFFKQGMQCELVEGTIDPNGSCKLWTEPMGMSMGEQLFVETPSVEDAPSWIPFLPRPGKYAHPTYGELNITPEQNAELVESVRSHVYQQHIPLDLEHDTKLSGAVAWIRDARQNEDGSADANVEWTDRGKSLLKSGQFRYVSPEWFRTWRDPATGTVHKNVVAGGALTTRPFFKDKSLRALVASEGGIELRGSEVFRDYSTDERKEMAAKGWALSDLSYPIADKADLRNAIQAFGLGNNPRKKAHIIKRARALGAVDMLPESWGVTASEGDLMPDETTETTEQTEEQTPTETTEESTEETSEETLTATEVNLRITELTQQFNSRIEAAEALVATERTAREAAEARVAELEGSARQERFTELVRNRDGGAQWHGDVERNVAILTSLADAFGEDSDMFRTYVEQQQSAAAALHESGLFTELGSSASDSSTDDTSKLDALAKKFQSEHEGLTYAQAYSEVLRTEEGRKLYKG